MNAATRRPPVKPLHVAAAAVDADAALPAELNLRTLQRFMAIVQAGSVSRAAGRLGVSQPVLSRELRELERRFDVPLLHRHARGISPTPSGQALVERAAALLAAVQTLPDDVRAGTDVPSGRVTFGVPTSMHEMLTRPLVAHLRERYPAIRIQVREAMSSELHEALVAREIEVAVMAAPVSDRQLLVRPLLAEPMVLVGPPGSGLSPSRPLTLQQVAERPLIVPCFPNSARLLIEGALHGVGRRPQVAFEADTPVASFVHHGLGHALQPSCALLNRGMDGLCHAPVRGLQITWLLACPAGWALSRAATHLCQALYALAREAVRARRWRGSYLGP